MFFMWPWAWGWGGGIFGVLITIIIICVLIRVIFRIAHHDSWHHYRNHRNWDYWDKNEDDKSSARKILDERYARGEIREEYKAKKENLK